jgi:hypothetical protein
MATKSVLQTLKDEFAQAMIAGDVRNNKHSGEALNWYYNFIRLNINSMNSLEGLRAGKADNKMSPGSFYVYTYDPKYKETLPYYDTVPLILCTSLTPKGWYGINFHYIPPKIRLLIVKEMYKVSRMTANDNMKFKLSWQKAYSLGHALGQDKWMKHSIKQYLHSHIKSSLIKVKGDNIEPMVFLPIARFKKMSQADVWGAA